MSGVQEIVENVVLVLANSSMENCELLKFQSAQFLKCEEHAPLKLKVTYEGSFSSCLFSLVCSVQGESVHIMLLFSAWCGCL